MLERDVSGIDILQFPWPIVIKSDSMANISDLSGPEIDLNTIYWKLLLVLHEADYSVSLYQTIIQRVLRLT